jgi:transposase
METATQATVQETVAPTAEHFVERVKRRTRKKFSADEKVRIVIEGMKRETPISELARREGVSTALYYSWLKDFMEAGKSRLKGDSLRQANEAEVRGLRRENDGLKELVAEQALQLNLLKKSLSVPGGDGTGE